MAVSTPLTAQEKIRRILVNNLYQIDQNLPRWARRSNPIVKRELGLYWRIMPPQADSVLRAFWVQALIIAATIPIPFLLTLLLPLTLVSFALLPYGLYLYAQLLYNIAGDASSSMVAEVENATLDVIRMTPVPTGHLLLSKLAGSLWKQSEPFTLVLAIASLTQVPSLFIIYANLYAARDFPATAQILTVIMFATSLIRLPVEAFMVGALGQWVGLQTSGRGAAQATAIGLMGFYFLLINLPRLIPLGPVGRVLVDGVLPLATAAGGAWLLVALTTRMLKRGEMA